MPFKVSGTRQNPSPNYPRRANFSPIVKIVIYTPNSKSLERAWSRGIVDRTKEYSFVLSTMPRLHARSRLLELGVWRSWTCLVEARQLGGGGWGCYLISEGRVISAGGTTFSHINTWLYPLLEARHQQCKYTRGPPCCGLCNLALPTVCKNAWQSCLGGRVVSGTWDL